MIATSQVLPLNTFKCTALFEVKQFWFDIVIVRILLHHQGLYPTIGTYSRIIDDDIISLMIKWNSNDYYIKPRSFHFKLGGVGDEGCI